MRIVVVNVNTSESMTASIQEAAVRAAAPTTTILAVTPRFGPEAVDTAFEGYLAAVGVIDRVLSIDEPFDAVILAGFGEPGRDALQELIDQPVVDIAEASAHVATMLGRGYAVITTLQRSVPQIEDRLAAAGIGDRCVSIRATGLSTLEIDADADRARDAIVEVARRAVEIDKAEVICLGCAGMAGLDEAIASRLGVPVVDGVAAAVVLAESLVRLGLRTSKISTYARPDPKVIVGWPLSD